MLQKIESQEGIMNGLSLMNFEVKPNSKKAEDSANHGIKLKIISPLHYIHIISLIYQ